MTLSNGMTFRNLIVYLADRIGRHHIPVRDETHAIRDFVGPDGVHHDLITRFVRLVYRANGCGYLDAPVARPATAEVLERIRREVLSSTQTDIDQVRLIEELVTGVTLYFCVDPMPHTLEVPAIPVRGELIALPAARLRVRPSA